LLYKEKKRKKKNNQEKRERNKILVLVDFFFFFARAKTQNKEKTKTKMSNKTKTIALLASVDPGDDACFYIDDYPATIRYKKLKLKNLTKTDWSIIIAASNEPFATDESMFAIGRYIDKKYGSKTRWSEKTFKFRCTEYSSSDERDEEEKDNDSKYAQNFVESSDEFYEEGKSETIVKEFMGKCDAILESPFIYINEDNEDPDDPEEKPDFGELLEHWKSVLKGEEKDSDTKKFFHAKSLSRDELYKQYPFLEQELTDLTEDYFPQKKKVIPTKKMTKNKKN
jgi:hypothetical protein